MNHTSCNETLGDDDLCWEDVPSINRNNAYRIFLVSAARRVFGGATDSFWTSLAVRALEGGRVGMCMCVCGGGVTSLSKDQLNVQYTMLSTVTSLDHVMRPRGFYTD